MTRPVTREDIETSIELCRRHLTGLQTGRGNFRYEYDWERDLYSEDDNAVRQAGALWGLAKLHRLRPDEVLMNACLKGLSFYAEYSGTTAAGGRYSTYPGDPHGFTGSTALVALALIEFLRSPHAGDGADRSRWRGLLDEYLRFLLAAQRPDGRWPARYDAGTGALSSDAPSPYSDGEVLLALALAARYLECPGLGRAIVRGTAGAYRHYVLLALRRSLRSRATNGYYQWGTMAMYEIIGAGWAEAEDYRGIVAYLGDWMCGFRRLGERKTNPAAVLEGLIHAWDLAAATGDADRQRGYGNVVRACLERMLALQVGHPRADDFVRRAPDSAPALGGCQHWPDKPLLRIDFTQHQLHACLLVADLFTLDETKGPYGKTV